MIHHRLAIKMKGKVSFNSCLIFAYLIAPLFYACSSGRGTVGKSANHSAEPSRFVNPVFEPILADPTVVRDPASREFYAYGTQDDWGDGEGSRLVPVLKSKDLSDWELVGPAFQAKPTWKKEGGVWAPDVVYVNGKYFLYYAFSIWDDPNPGIGVATSDSPAGPFVDHGKLFDSKSIDVPNSIDPFLWVQEGQKYLFWGSYNDGPKQGTFGVPMRQDGLRITSVDDKFKIAAGDLEAVIIHKRNGYYYFIGSRGHCCAGASSSYHMVVGRASDLNGPYLDKNGHDLKERGNGTLLLKGGQKFVGLGHGTRIITDDRQQDWILFHGIDVEQGTVSSGASRRMLFLDRLFWEDNWPVMRGNTTNSEQQDKPYFK
ncbi:MAG: family 43 glycosylhydrolase [Sphingobacterium sp.]